MDVFLSGVAAACMSGYVFVNASRADVAVISAVLFMAALMLSLIGARKA